MSVEDVEGIRRCMMSLLVDAQALARIEARFYSCSPEMQRTLSQEKLEIIARMNRTTRELFHILPEHLRPDADSVLTIPRGPRTGSSDGRKNPGPKPGGQIPRNVRWPDWTIEQILALADAYKSTHGKWPTRDAGRVGEPSPDTWAGIDLALRHGNRGLPGGTSLARLLAEYRAKRSSASLPALNVEQILEWADDHRARTGSWPRLTSGTVCAAPDETWLAIDHALRRGTRGVEIKSSLARLLANRRGAPNHLGQEILTVAQILEWADTHYARTGRWPTRESGPVAEAPHENWGRINHLLIQGNRGLRSGSSLARLLAEHRGVRNRKALPHLKIEEILQWADLHYSRFKRWPTCWSGPVEDAPDESWNAIDAAFKAQGRGLRECGYRSLAHLLDERRGKLQRRGNRPAQRILDGGEASEGKPTTEI